MLRPCLTVGCPALVDKGRCAAHRRSDAPETRRGKTAERGYDAVWRRLRLLVLAEEPICRRCQHEFTADIDHVIPLRVRPDLRLVRSNLQGLCRACHRVKTEEDKTRYAGTTAETYEAACT